MKSGGAITLYFVLIDKYYTIVRSDNTSKLLISVERTSTNQESTKDYSTVIETATKVICVNGVFTVQDLVLVGKPNST
jgi:hypothetical protein